MNVICITGKAQHGKDTLAGFLLDTLESRGKRVLITHYGDLLKYVCWSFFGWDGKKDEAGRSLLQYVGTEKIRAKKPDFWVNFIRDILSMFPNEWDTVIIPDCRYPNECDMLRDLEYGVSVIRVIRDGFVSPLTEAQQAHPSETSMDGYQTDYTIHNDGTLDDLRKKADEWLMEAGLCEN